MALGVGVVAAHQSCVDLAILHLDKMDLVLGTEEGDEQLVGPVLDSLNGVVETGGLDHLDPALGGQTEETDVLVHTGKEEGVGVDLGGQQVPEGAFKLFGEDGQQTVLVLGG